MGETARQAIAQGAIWSCWALFGLVWLISAGYNRVRGPRPSVRSRYSYGWLLLGGAAWLGVRHVRAHGLWVGSAAPWWVQLIGVVVLVVATGFTLWARFALGTMWSSAAVVKQGHVLRTDGPYSIVRHPIYTGLIGMLLGTAAINGLGWWLLLPVAAVVLFELKIRNVERLMRRTFGRDYDEYRRRVPQLVPRLRLGK